MSSHWGSVDYINILSDAWEIFKLDLIKDA